MNFKFLKAADFDLLIQNYEQLSSKTFNKQLLIHSIFLQLYSQLEEALYFECEQDLIKKNASILRFENSLKDQGYKVNNESWLQLLELAKIRNCLLHGNGRVDNDKYGQETSHIITSINKRSSKCLIELVEVKKDHFAIKISEELLFYFLNLINEWCLIQEC